MDFRGLVMEGVGVERFEAFWLDLNYLLGEYD